MMDIVKKLLKGEEIKDSDMAWEMFNMCERCQKDNCFGCPIVNSSGKTIKECKFRRNGMAILEEYRRLIKQNLIKNGEFLPKELREDKSQPVEQKEETTMDELKTMDDESLMEWDWKILLAIAKAKGPDKGIPMVTQIIKEMDYGILGAFVSYLMLTTIDEEMNGRWIANRLKLATKKLGDSFGITGLFNNEDGEEE